MGEVRAAALLVTPSASSRALAAAVTRGLVTITDLDELTGELDPAAADPAQALLAAAVGSGLLHSEAVEQLVAEAARRPPPSDPTPLTAASPATPALLPGGLLDAFDAFPARGWERYELMEFIGRGGMGEVFKARDPRLNRYVAIKFLRRDDPSVLTRFKREAQVQARIDHDNVCPVYEVGEVSGLHYIAMQYVAGGSLKEISDLLTVRDKAAIMVDVAAALDAAHRVGLVHRDVKPANIMVDRHHDGSWRPFVVDFGIARDIENVDLTATGALLGTPSFAAPEQIRGDTRAIDARTDIYSLGATLYWFLTDHAPFEGGYPEILDGVSSHDPLPPRRHAPEVPADLETIVLKCLEKEPSRRYQSASEVAADLRRFLDGEPIAARRASLAYRLVTKLRKHRSAAVAATVAMVVIATLAGANLRSSLRAKRLASLAQDFAGEVKEVETVVRREAMMPLHDTRHLRGLVAARMASIEAEMARLGDLACGPGHFALGSGELALTNHEEAVEHLRAAWESGYREAPVAFALGLALGRLYRERQDEAAAIADPAARASFERELEATLRDPALASLHQAEGVGGVAPAYVTGLIAFFEDDYEAALAGARAAAAQEPWLYEAHRLEGDVRVAQAEAAAQRGDVAAALTSYAEAGAAYARASDIARSDASVYEADCSRLCSMVDTLLRVGRPADTAFADATAACGRAVAADSGRARAFAQLSEAYWLWGDHQNDVGRDPTASLEAARVAAERAIALDEASFLAHFNLGATWRVLGLQSWAAGSDARDAFTRAVTSLERAVALRPSFVAGHDELGYALDRRARAEQEFGQDPRPTLDRAIASFERAIALDPGYANPHNNLGIAWWRRGAFERRSDPAAAGAALARAIACYDAALAVNPRYAHAFLNRGLAHRTLALLELDAGRDPSSAIVRARADLERGLAINPEPYWAYLELVATAEVEARWRMANRQSPEPQLAAAAAAAATALATNPKVAGVHQTAADVHRWRAEWLLSQSRSASAEIAAGRRLVDRALALSPRHGRSLLTRAGLLLLAAETATGASERRALATAARADLARAVTVNAFLAADAAPLEQRAQVAAGE